MKRAVLGPAVRLAALAALAAAPASAAPKADVERAERLFAEAKSAMRAGAFDAACAKLAESDRLDPAPGTLRNLAECEEKRGHLVLSRKLLQGAIGRSPDPEILKLCTAQLAALDARLPRLLIAAPAAAVVRIGGTAVSEEELGFDGPGAPVDPGTHVVTLEAAGHETATQRVDAEEGARIRVAIAFPSPPGPRTEPAHATTATAPPRGAAPIIGYVALGMGAVGLGVATVLGVELGKTRSELRDCRTKGCSAEQVDDASTARARLPIYYGSLAVGVAGLGVGTYLLLSPQGGERQSGVGVRLSPAGASAEGRF